MKLLYKEFVLAAHPSLYVYMLLGCLVIVPGYPFSVIFLFGCLAPYITFTYFRENNDSWYTSILPVTKSEIVSAKYRLIVIVQLGQLLFSIPFALLRPLIGIGNNPVGMDANLAWYGCGLLTYGAFNLLFFPTFYKTGYKAGKAFLLGLIPAVLCMLFAEVSVHIPGFLWLDSTHPHDLLMQSPILLAGILFYAASSFLSRRIAIRRFEQVNL